MSFSPYSFVMPVKQSKTEIELASGITHKLLSRTSFVFISEESVHLYNSHALSLSLSFVSLYNGGLSH